eukprot:2667552-Pleurochrysis_carterae.AAC.1
MALAAGVDLLLVRRLALWRRLSGEQDGPGRVAPQKERLKGISQKYCPCLARIPSSPAHSCSASANIHSARVRSEWNVALAKPELAHRPGGRSSAFSNDVKVAYRRLGEESQPGNELTFPPCSGVSLAAPRSLEMAHA